MSYQYATRKRTETAAPQTEKAAPAAPSMDALRAGAAAPTQQMLGHKVDLPDAICQKMEDSFQADLSSVQLYESQAVADAGAKAMAQGNRIAFAPGQLDLTSSSGQALLGHELSHVVSQARGEVACQGFLQDSALEARADREGAMAAAGESIYSGVTPLSDVSCAPAAGPMQAKGKKKKPEISAPYDVEHHTIGDSMAKPGEYDSNHAASVMQSFAPIAKADVASKSHLSETDGNRFTIMRGGAGAAYNEELKKGTQGINRQILPFLVQATSSTSSLPTKSNGELLNDPESLNAYQDAAIAQFGRYLSIMEQDKDAMDSLRQSAQTIYQPMGTYSEKNKGGVTGGEVGYANHAMNDILLRSFGPDILNGRSDLPLDPDHYKRVGTLSNVMARMQSHAMTASGNEENSNLNPHELQLSQMLTDFYTRNNLISNSSPSAADPSQWTFQQKRKLYGG